MYFKKRFQNYLLLGALLTLIGFGFYFQAARAHIDELLLKSRIASLERNIHYIGDIIDYISQREGASVEEYLDILIFVANDIDQTKNVYAELMDKEFKTLTTRKLSPENTPTFSKPFDPRLYPELLELFRQEQEGSHYWVHKESEQTDTGAADLGFYLCWKWIPTGRPDEKQVLLVVGVSKYSVDAEIDKRMVYGIVALYFVCTCFIMFSIMTLTIDRRKSDRREENKSG